MKKNDSFKVYASIRWSFEKGYFRLRCYVNELDVLNY